MKRLIVIVIMLLCVISCASVCSCTCDEIKDSATFIGLMKLLPANTLSNDEIILINYSKIWDDAGISFYKEDGSKMNREEIIDVTLSSLMVRIGGDTAFEFSSFYSGMSRMIGMPKNLFDTLGYTPMADVHAEIIYGSARDKNIMIGMKGNFTLDATRNALKNQDEWPERVKDNFAIESYLGIPVYSWGDYIDGGLAEPLSPPHLDLWGIARPLVAMDGNMLIGDTVDNVKAMIDAVTGESTSLADIPEYALIAERMDSLGVYAVIMSKTMTERDQYQLLLPLQQFLAVGFGDGKDERGNYTSVVAVYENEDLAEENALILEERLVEVAMILEKNPEFTDIQHDGRVLFAKLYIDETSLGLNWLYIVRSYRDNK